MSDSEETILIFPRPALSSQFGWPFRYRPLPEGPGACRILLARVLSHARLSPRTAELERDADIKQAVAYVILRRPGASGTEFWLYRRCKRVGDERLRGLLSLGVGGHMGEADLDGSPSLIPGTDVLFRAAVRELTEEIGEFSAAVGLHGLVNYEGDPVGRCHLGFVFTATFPAGADPLAVPGQGVEPLGWYTANDLYRLQDRGAGFEPWAEGVLSALQAKNLGGSRGLSLYDLSPTAVTYR